MAPIQYGEQEEDEKKCPPDEFEICQTTKRRQTPGSNAFVPSVAGLIIAGEVVKDLIK